MATMKFCSVCKRYETVTGKVPSYRAVSLACGHFVHVFTKEGNTHGA